MEVSWLDPAPAQKGTSHCLSGECVTLAEGRGGGGGGDFTLSGECVTLAEGRGRGGGEGRHAVCQVSASH